MNNSLRLDAGLGNLFLFPLWSPPGERHRQDQQHTWVILTAGQPAPASDDQLPISLLVRLHLLDGQL